MAFIAVVLKVGHKGPWEAKGYGNALFARLQPNSLIFGLTKYIRQVVQYLVIYSRIYLVNGGIFINIRLRLIRSF